ncbi:hypothetical protein K402DRAFT_372022, partial [Aulographum hederae CBS 113979]
MTETSTPISTSTVVSVGLSTYTVPAPTTYLTPSGTATSTYTASGPTETDTTTSTSTKHRTKTAKSVVFKTTIAKASCTIPAHPYVPDMPPCYSPWPPKAHIHPIYPPGGCGCPCPDDDEEGGGGRMMPEHENPDEYFSDEEEATEETEEEQPAPAPTPKTNRERKQEKIAAFLASVHGKKTGSPAESPVPTTMASVNRVPDEPITVRWPLARPRHQQRRRHVVGKKIMPLNNRMQVEHAGVPDTPLTMKFAFPHGGQSAGRQGVEGMSINGNGQWFNGQRNGKGRTCACFGHLAERAPDAPTITVTASPAVTTTTTETAETSTSTSTSKTTYTVTSTATPSTITSGVYTPTVTGPTTTVTETEKTSVVEYSTTTEVVTAYLFATIMPAAD